LNVVGVHSCLFCKKMGAGAAKVGIVMFQWVLSQQCATQYATLSGEISTHRRRIDNNKAAEV